MIKTIGILGAGQLARMMAQAGLPLGLDFVFLDPAEDACAAEYGKHICASWDDEAALEKLGRLSDVVTFDFENVPESSASLIESLCPVYPPPRALYKSQDRLREKTMMQELGIPVAPFSPVKSRPDLAAAIEKIDLPCVLKTRRFGYDGKGQMVLRFQEDMERAWQALGDAELICEGFVPFDLECSIIAARGREGQTVYWPLTRNLHRDGILAVSRAPVFGRKLQQRAESLMQSMLDHLDYTGVMALELFLKDDELLANEFAPRVHNSGHWTIDGAATSQFENHLRAICGLPLGEPGKPLHSLMFNLLGEMPGCSNQTSADYTPVEGLHWHDYRKTPRAGRKIGHVTVTAENESELRTRTAQLARQLGMAAELNLEMVL